ncbi:hypothetical protein N752_13405 [Desulforamulus aquiferis]|nr:hypothetical protein [Desulforamulus aquiferis]RYD04365.1 hypothetical protein N752_13405 [Desulforamulus aquiferis]
MSPPVKQSAWAQAAGSFTPEYEKIFGGRQGDRGFHTIETPDGGFIVLGETNSYHMHGSGGTDAYLVKFDDKGYIQWQKTYGGGSNDLGTFIQQTTDGGYIFTGSTKSFNRSSDEKIYLVKTDDKGVEMWFKTLGGTGEDSGSCVRQTLDGGYIVAGQTTSSGAGESDFYLIKLDDQGKVLWEKTFGGKQTEICTSVIETRDGGYLQVGRSNSFGDSYAIYLVKTDPKGNKIWEKVLGSTDWDTAVHVEETPEGGFILAGESAAENATGLVASLVKTDSLGNLQWERKYSGVGYSIGKSVRQLEAGGYLLAGWTLSKDRSGFDLYLVRTDGYGYRVWEKTLENEKFSQDFSIQQGKSGLTVTGWWADRLKWNPVRDDGVQVYLLKLKNDTP